ncbi:MAG: CHASE3 domain-containing protein, partial [Planctomycetota bacterium]
MFKSLSLKAKILAGSGVTLILMIILGVISIDATDTLTKSNKMVDHTHVVIRTANEILASAVDMETGMRGYLLAGQEGFLDPYKAGQKKFTDTLTGLQKTVDDNPQQVALLDESRKTIEDWQEKVVEPNIAMRRAIGDAKSMNDLAAEIAKAKGKVYFDRFREQISTFIGRETKLMVERQKQAKAAEVERVEAQKLIADTVRWVNHTRNVIETANEIIAAAVNMETGARGYLLAGKEEFLDPYRGGKAKFTRLVESLQKTVNDNPQQVALLEEVKSSIADWQSKIIEPNLELRKRAESGKATMQEVATEVAKAKGKVYFDDFRNKMATFIGRETKLMAERQEAAKTAEADRAKAQQLIADTTGWVNHTRNVIETANQITASAVNMETGVRGFLLAGKEEFLAPYKGGQKDFARLVASLQKTVDDNPQQVALLGEAQSTISDWLTKVIEPQIELRVRIGQSKTMDDIRDLTAKAEGKVYFDEFRKQIATFVGRELTLMKERQEQAESTSSSAISMILGGIVVAVLIAVVISLVLAGSITGPFKQIFQGLKAFSNAELDGVRSSFRQIVDGLSSSSAQVGSASQQIAAGASEQASSLEEVSASLEEIASMTKQNAENAQQANTVAAGAQTDSEKGVESVSRMSAAINDIKKSADDTAKIVKTIDEIAFQTNLLALNAAVEAARAGDAGKGFAVVAEEVRNLAQRSAEAAKSTAALIEESQQAADNGVAVSTEVGEMLTKIGDGVEKVTALVKEVAAASAEQTQGIDQVNSAVAQMDKVTQENAAATEELSAQAQEMDGLMGVMLNIVGKGGGSGSAGG